jgi:serine/threonine protein kinase
MNHSEEFKQLLITAAENQWLTMAQVVALAIDYERQPHNTSMQRLSLYLTEEQQSLLHKTTIEPSGEGLSTNKDQRKIFSLEAERYQHREELGRGGMGVVIRAVDHRNRRDVAFKMLHQKASPHLARQFIQEAFLTAALEHPAIIPVYDVGLNEAGEPYFAMRIVKQRSLKEVLAQEQTGLKRLCHILIQVCQALEHAHSRGVIHRKGAHRKEIPVPGQE